LRKWFIRLIDSCRRYKRILVPLGEGLFFAGALVLSYYLRLGGIGGKYVPQILFLMAVLVPLKVLLFWFFKLYHISFRFTSLYEVLSLLKASLVGALAFSMLALVARDLPVMEGFPRSVVVIDFLLTFLVGSGVRLFFRMYYFPHVKFEGKKRALVVGAGSAGEQLVREMKTSPLSPYEPVAFVDDDPAKRGSLVHGVKVEGGKEDIPQIVESLGVEEVIIAIPSASSSQIRSIMEYIRKSGVKGVKIIPGLSSILSGMVTLGDIREITIEDLLGREPVEIDMENIASFLVGKRVMITGAGGSIGSELCRQVAAFGVSSLIMVDMGETELFYIDWEMKDRFSGELVSVVADVKDEGRMREIFQRHSPQVVFHAAAYKHVPLMEENAREAVLNNVEGTRVVAFLAREFGVEKFVFISTDKAVNPTSIMGATKRVAENLLRCLGDGKCRFVSVRFGNVLGSRGSVVPIFREQIKRGGPVTVTHPDMVRYLMSIPEAVRLVLQAGAMGEGGEVFVLDMGEPVRILDLAKEMIRLCGLEPDRDIPIVFTGKRPGEKLFEELLTAEEGTAATKHEKIFIARSADNVGLGYMEKVMELIEVARNNGGRCEIIGMLKELVPTFEWDGEM